MSAHLPPDNPEEWIRRARSSLAIARGYKPDIYREDLCFQAQQAAEKAIKAVFIARSLPLPYIHDISELLLRIEKSGLVIPEAIKIHIPSYSLCSTYPIPGF